MIESLGAPGQTLQQYVDMIERDEHRVFAQHLLDHAVEGWHRREAELLERHGHSNWRHFLSYDLDAFPAVSHAVKRVIADDIVRRLELTERGHPGVGFQSEYDRHMRKQERRQEKRRQTLKAQGGFAAPRDSQRQRLYDAERCLDAFHQKDWGPGSVPAMQEYVDKLLASAWWKRRYPSLKPGRITVIDGSGHRRAVAYTSSWRGRAIAMPLWARKEWVMLHELAHHATSVKHHNVASHGREFARIYVELVEHCISRYAADRLKLAFREARVKYSKPRTMTPEQKAAAAARLATARAARARP